jgi:RPA family protein
VFVYAGQYQPEAMQFLQQADTPSYVAVVGKLRPYEAGDRVNVAIEPEFVAPVEEETRDAWTVETVAHTRKRLDAFETGHAPFVDEATAVYSEDVSTIEDAVVATATM